MEDSSFTAGVPDRSHYHAGYLLDNRLFSYAHQIQSVLTMEPQGVLEIGTGTGMVAAALRAVGVEVTTLDVEPTLNPDLLGSVLNIPAADHTFDVASCCQVLEHLPLEEFPNALRELYRITRKGVVLSLPDATRRFYISWRLPKMRARQLEWSTSLFRSLSLPPAKYQQNGHHWEIGYQGCSLQQTRDLITRAGWTIAHTWRVPEKPWHRFFDLRHS